jgi:hypothetical protein
MVLQRALVCMADISTAATRWPVLPGNNTIICHTLLGDIIIKTKNNISLEHRQMQMSGCG